MTALVALLAWAGCTVKDACAGGTVLVAVSLNDAAAQADELVIDVALDGDAPRETALAHAPGSAAGNVVVQFPAGYPHGHTVSVTVLARAAGVVLGSGSVSVTLGDDCEAVALTVTPGDADLGGSDGAADGGAPPDLTPPADLAQCVPKTEDCFNGVDDDCDGMPDCADPDCVTTAVCVPPVTAPFVVGSTLDDPMSLCPTSYTKLEVINAGLSAPSCTTANCSCSMVCQTQVEYFFSGCPNTDNENQLSVVYNTMCQSWATWNNTVDVHQLSTPLSCTAGGIPTVPTPTWANSKEFCSTALHGAGCSGGNWCVPATPGAKCEVADGTQTCDPGYTAVSGGPWYTGLSDTRSCSCSCGAPTGSCGTTVTLYTDNGCTTGAASFPASMTNNINCSVSGGPYHSGKINVAPTACGTPGLNQGGSLSGTGPQTLCCVP